MTMSEGDYQSPEESGENRSTVNVVVLTVQDRSQRRQDEPGQYDIADVFPLPSSKYRYSKWHEMEDIDVRGNMLRSPRVRRAPRGYKLENLRKLEEKERQELADSDEEDFRPVLSLKKSKPKKSHNYRNKLENWENAEAVNLSYQDLGHPFQRKEFLRVLKRLIRCEHVQLLENSIQDLNSVFLPRCTQLYLQRNYITELKKLPKAPMLEHLSLQQNHITSLAGLEGLQNTRLRSLILKGNPVELDPHYRQSVFAKLPDLEMLDGIPRLESDNEDPIIAKTCVIS